ncbi:hypothetical protein FSP39_006727 [Pinctada imbricata]|uniref:Protein SMG7 n=1 Tax=Pinctada imbricata TaxID=66713 RepID=A0AA88XTQ3_PINIB|nr:hypothetical protein FSP39_006727 [Pinctada imbricata]
MTVDVKSSMRKQEIRNILAKELLAEEIFSSYDFPVEHVSSETKMSKYEFELEKMKMQLQFEREEKERQFEKEEKERQFEREKEERKKQERMHEKELQFELEKLKLERSAKENPVPSLVKSEFDAAKKIRLVPKFQEKSVDKYFPHFEKIAANLKWPRDFWPTLLQSVLTGKAAEVYSALSIAESSDYDKVKDTILRAYQLVPEAYRQKFRKYKKFENQTYVEFAREKEDLFDQWFRSKKIPNSFDNLRQIILIEEFKECVHQDLRTHLEDKNVKTLEEAAVLSDTYALTHKKNFVSKTQSSDSAKTSDVPKKNVQESQSSISSQSPSQGGSTSGPRSERSEASPGVGSLPTCNYCKKKGHVIGERLKLKKKKELKSQACASVRNDRKALDSICYDTPEIQGSKSSSDDFVEDHYKPFLSQGFVSLSDSSEALPVQILRDTGAAQTLLLEGSLPLSEHTFTGRSVLLQGVELGVIDVPLHKIYLKSDLITGPVIVGVRPTLPVQGVSLLLGNDLAGGKVVADPIVCEKITSDVVSDDEDDDLWNYAFKNNITGLQTQTKDKLNTKRGETQATLNLFLETASGFYLQLFQLICTTFKLDFPFRRKSACFGLMKARYRQQIDQAQTYYWHAANLVPFNGQPYNQLAIVEAAKGNKLSTVFYYIRSLAVRHPFPAAATNLEKLFTKLIRDMNEMKGKLSVSEMITAFLQFHAAIHLCTELDKAQKLSSKLITALPAHVTSQSFPSYILVQIVAINIFAMHHALRHMHGNEEGSEISSSQENLGSEEQQAFDSMFSFTVSIFDVLLQYTPKQEQKLKEFFTLPAVKLLLDWLKLNPEHLNNSTLKSSGLWSNLCKVLNNTKSPQSDNDNVSPIAKYEDLPLPEDTELRSFQYLEKAHSGYSYSRLPSDGLPSDIESQLRCSRLLDHGKWIAEEHANQMSVPDKEPHPSPSSSTTLQQLGASLLQPGGRGKGGPFSQIPGAGPSQSGYIPLTPGNQQQGTYSLFSSSPWAVPLSTTDTKSKGSSPFSSESNSIRNSPDPGADNSDIKLGSGFDLGLRFNNKEEQWQERAPPGPEQGKAQGQGPYFPGSLQSIWSSSGPSPLERLLEMQRQRQNDPH